MKTIDIYKRTFEAKNFPKGSQERSDLNASGVTSEYMPSLKFESVGKHEDGSFWFSIGHRTRRDAIDSAERLKKPFPVGEMISTLEVDIRINK